MKDTKISHNPFSFGGTVNSRQFVNREEDRQEIATDIKNHTNLILYAPRRYGKTSLILQVFEDMKKADSKFIGIYIDFYKIHSKEKFLQVFSREFSQNMEWSADKILSFFKSIIKTVSPSITMDNEGKPKLDIAFQRPMKPNTFEEIMRLPETLAKKGFTVAVFFDEFQEIIRLNGHNFQQELRAEIQHHSNVSYIFCGSKQHLISEIFSQSKSPLYNIGKMKYVHKISEKKFIPFILRNMKKVQSNFRTANAREIYQFVNGIPYYVQMLSYETYNLALMNPDTPPELLIQFAIKKIIEEKNEEFIMMFGQLSPSQKKIMEIVLAHNGANLFRHEILAEFSIPTSTLKKGLSLLVESGMLTQNNKYSITDVFFEKWMKNI